jgi:hypothetical protein
MVDAGDGHPVGAGDRAHVVGGQAPPRPGRRTTTKNGGGREA